MQPIILKKRLFSGQVGLSIVILNYNTLNLLKRCLDNITNLEIDFEIIVIDNASQDGSSEWLAELEDPRVRVIVLPENRGFSGGCNVGIQASSGDHVLLLNTDAFPSLEALMTLSAYLESHPQVGIVGPQLLYENGKWQPSAGLYPSPKSAFWGAGGIVALSHFFQEVLWPITGRWWRARSVNYIDGACMLIRHAVIDQIGLLDESFFFFVEDAEFCHRARKHGWLTHYVPQSRVIHLRGGSSSQKNFEKSTTMQLTSKKIFIERVYGHKGWKKTTFWTAINYWIRYYFCRILAKNSFKCKRYQFLKEIYWKEYLTSRTV